MTRPSTIIVVALAFAGCGGEEGFEEWCEMRMNRDPSDRSTPNANLAWGTQDVPPSHEIDPPVLPLNRPLLRWRTCSGLPESVAVELFSNRPGFATGTPIRLIARVEWTVQTAQMIAEIDFIHGTKFSLAAADGLTITTIVERGIHAFAEPLRVAAVVSQAAVPNVNGLAPQRTLRRRTPDTASPVLFEIPRFARKVQVLRIPNATPYTIEFLDNTGAGPIAAITIAGFADLFWQLPIPNDAARLRIVSAPDLTDISVIYSIDL